jgi:hypothetical protein
MADAAEKKMARIGLTELLRVMRAARVSIARQISEGVANPGRWEDKLSRISATYELIRRQWAEYISSEIPEQYGRGIKAAAAILKERLRQSVPELGTVAALVSDSIARMNLATREGEELVHLLFRRTQQAALLDEEISRRLAEGLTDEATPNNLKKILKTDLYKALSGGNVLLINGRRYKVDNYAETLARTRTREAQSAATLDTVNFAGEDLVRVSSHNTTTPLCKKGNKLGSPVYEGSINSLSGRHPKYQKLDRVCPFHPNCQHVITAYIEVAA